MSGGAMGALGSPGPVTTRYGAAFIAGPAETVPAFDTVAGAGATFAVCGAFGWDLKSSQPAKETIAIASSPPAVIRCNRIPASTFLLP